MLRGILLKSKNTKGFTIVEVLAIILVVGILSTIGVVSFQGAQKNTRDSQRVNQITIIAETLEKYYDKNGQYPDCPTITGATSPLKDIDQKVLIAPKSNSASVACSTPSATNDVFYYNFNVGDGSWKLEYFNEGQNTSKIAVSSRRITATIPDPSLPVLAAPALTATKNGKYAIDLSWNTYAPNNSTKFIVNYSTSSSFPAASTNVKTLTRDTLSYQLTSLSAGTKYYVRIKAMGDNISYADSAFSSTVNATTDPDFYTMYASVTPDGAGSITGVTNPYSVNASASITASAGSGYQFSFWENCSSSGSATINITMSSDKTCTANFTVNYYALNVLAGTGGTAGGGGSYEYGSVRSITNAPNTDYYFSGWSGDGCSTGTVTMPAYAVTCTANFTKILQPTNYNITVSTSGKTYDGNLAATWTWGATCQSGTTPKYQYYIQKSNPSYDSSWLPNGATTDATSYTLSNSDLTINRHYTVFFRSRCEYNNSHFGDWHSYVYKSINTEVSPPSSVVFKKTRDILGNLIAAARVNCGDLVENDGGGSNARFDIYSTSVNWGVFKGDQLFYEYGPYWYQARRKVFNDGLSIWSQDDWNNAQSIFGAIGREPLKTWNIGLLGSSDTNVWPDSTNLGMIIIPKCVNRYGFEAYNNNEWGYPMRYWNEDMTYEQTYY